MLALAGISCDISTRTTIMKRGILRELTIGCRLIITMAPTTPWLTCYTVVFWMRFFYKLGLVPTPEPFKRMMYNAYIMAPDGQKMSKSKGNVIDPMEIMDSGYGADALRVYEMFIAPYDMDAPWDPRGVPGTYQVLKSGMELWFRSSLVRITIHVLSW